MNPLKFCQIFEKIFITESCSQFIEDSEIVNVIPEFLSLIPQISFFCVSLQNFCIATTENLLSNQKILPSDGTDGRFKAIFHLSRAETYAGN